jgi:heme/copper-type cytochrome/quinol oxidase subunit 1
LTASLSLTILLASFLFGWTSLKGDLDIHLHDTYFVISSWLILIPLFFLVTFIIYFIKEFRKQFSRTFSNWLLIIAGVTLIISLTFLIQSFSQFLIGGFTLYPPLSALGPDKIPELTQDPVAKFITSFLTVIQIVVLFMLLFFVYCWGTQKKRESRT